MLLLVAVRLSWLDVSVEVRQFTFGMGAAAALLIIGDVLVRLLRKQGRRALLALPGLVAVTGCLTSSLHSTTTTEGVLATLIVAAIVGTVKYIDTRHHTAPH